MKKTIAIALAVLTLVNAGCATDHSIETPTAKLSIQYATMKFIRRDPVRAERIKRIVAEIRRSVEGDSTTSIDLIKTTIQGYLPPDMMPEDRLAVNALIDLVIAELNARINDQLLLPETQLKIKVVADWVIEAASYYSPRVGVVE